jgi:hypothetical protein
MKFRLWLVAGAAAVVVVAAIVIMKSNRATPDPWTSPEVQDTHMAVDGKRDPEVPLEALRQPAEIPYVPGQDSADGQEPPTSLRGIGWSSRSLGPVDRGENPQLWEAMEAAPRKKRQRLDEIRATVDGSDFSALQREADAIVNLIRSEALLNGLRNGDYVTIPKGEGGRFLGNTASHVFVLHGGWRKDGQSVDLIFPLALERYPDLRDSKDYAATIKRHRAQEAASAVNRLGLDEREVIAGALVRQSTNVATEADRALLRRWFGNLASYIRFDERRMAHAVN